MSNELPWAERVTMLSINPDAATRHDIAQMAADLTELMQASQETLQQFTQKVEPISFHQLAVAVNDIRRRK